MIDKFDFENALKIIASYQLQFEYKLNKNSIGSARKIDIQDDISDTTFKPLQNYYWNEFKINLTKEDLSEMDTILLGKINYQKLQGYRGFGKVRLDNFKKLMISYLVLDKEEI